MYSLPSNSCRQSGGLSHWFILVGVTIGVWGAAPDGLGQSGPIPDPIPHGPITIELQTFASGLISPGLLLSPKDGTDREFIVEQTGQILAFDQGVPQATPFLDVSSRLVSLSPGYDERGLLGFTFDPGFADSGSPGYRRVFTYTSEPVGGAPDFTDPFATSINHHSVLTSWLVDANNPNAVDVSSRMELLRFEEPQSNHNGGTIEFGPDGMLYIGTGDGGGANDNNGNGHNPTIGNGQDLSMVLGKVLRIDPNGANSTNGRYGIPSDNPFAVGGGLPEIFASGFRNPYRMGFDGDSLLVADVGQNNVEELDLVISGGNYGWRYKEGSFKFNPGDGSVSTDLSGLPPGLIDPILEYDHDEGISIIGGYVYHGSLLPELTGKYVFGDFSTSFGTPDGRLFYADLQTSEIREFIIGPNDDPLGIFVKGLGVDAEGELYVLGSTTLGPSGTNGVAVKIVPEPTTIAIDLAAGLLLCGRRRRP